MPGRLKHRWSVGNNYLAGITAGDWWRLLRENRFAVDPACWHRAAFISLASVMNSLCRKREERLYDDDVAKTPVRPPLFVLGHWRSGTTHLHNLLAQDTIPHPGRPLSRAAFGRFGAQSGRRNGHPP